MATMDHQREHEAFATLTDLYLRNRQSKTRLTRWKAAQEQLESRYTRERAMASSADCAERIALLRIPEPEPLLEDCYAGDGPPLPHGRCGLLVDLARHHFDILRHYHPVRERSRRTELAWAEKLLQALQRAEAAKLQTPPARSGPVPSFGSADLATTAEELDQLFRDRKDDWVLVGFVSVLVQRHHRLQPLKEDGKHSNRRIDSPRDLERFLAEVSDERSDLMERLDCYMRSAALQRLFGDRDNYAEAEPVDVIDAADAVMDFYEQTLLLARSVRSATARADLAGAVTDLADIVAEPVATVDRWINDLIGFTAMLPQLAASPASADMRYELALDLRVEDDRLDRVRDVIHTAPGPVADSVYLRRWKHASEVGTAVPSDIQGAGDDYQPSPQTEQWALVGIIAACIVAVLVIVWIVSIALGATG